MNLQRRNRILRATPAIRSMVAETLLTPNDFIAPLFIEEGKNISTEIASMPGYYRRSIDGTIDEVKDLWKLLPHAAPKSSQNLITFSFVTLW
jgi:porphobilinogen synthase